MTTPPTDLSIRGNNGGARHRRPIVGLGVALVVTAGAYATTDGSGRAAAEARLTPARSEYVMPSERAMRELDHTIRALYGAQSRREPAPRCGR